MFSGLPAGVMPVDSPSSTHDLHINYINQKGTLYGVPEGSSMKHLFLLFAAAAALICTACSTPTVTNTARNSVEEMLLSAVVERGISSIDFEAYAGKKVFMDYSNLAPQVDKEFLMAYIELHLARFGAIVAKDAADADYIFKATSSVLATDMDKFLLGIPSLPIPIPWANLSIVIPEIPIIMRLQRTAWGRFFFNIVDAKTNEPVQIVDGAKSEAAFNNWVVCFIPFKTHRLPIGDDNPGKLHFIWFWED